MVIQDVKAGESIEMDVLCKKVERRKRGNAEYFLFVLVDETSAEMEGNTLAERIPDAEQFAGKAVHITGFAGIENGSISVAISSMVASEKELENFIPSLPSDKAEFCQTTLKKMLSQIGDEALRTMTSKLLSNGDLRRYPSTLSEQGKYAGGALHQTTLVAVFCYQLWKQREQYSNGLYQQPLDKDVLLVSALLHLISRPREYTPYPWKRTVEGVRKGSAIISSEMIRDCCNSESLGIKEETLDAIVHCIAAVHSQGKLRSISKEAMLLRCAITAYTEADVTDKEIVRLRAEGMEGGVAYSTALHSFLQI